MRTKTLPLKITEAIADDWAVRCIHDVIPGLPEFKSGASTLQVSATVMQEVLADAEFNADTREGPEYMQTGLRSAYRALAARIRILLRAEQLLGISAR